MIVENDLCDKVKYEKVESLVFGWIRSIRF